MEARARVHQLGTFSPLKENSKLYYSLHFCCFSFFIPPSSSFSSVQSFVPSFYRTFHVFNCQNIPAFSAPFPASPVKNRKLGNSASNYTQQKIEMKSEERLLDKIGMTSVEIVVSCRTFAPNSVGCPFLLLFLCKKSSSH